MPIDISKLDAVLLLSPFLEVVRSGDTSGPITALALSSVDKFITYSLVHRDSPNLAAAMTSVAGAGTHCKFEASDSVSDEAVLLKILDVLRHTLTSDLGSVLTDEAVCEMMETGLSMCCQMRLSEMLRRSAERTMQAMIISVFRRLQTLPSPAAAEEEGAPSSSAFLHESARMNGGGSADGTVTPLAIEDQTLRMSAPDPTSGKIPAASTPAAPLETTSHSPVFQRSMSFASAAGPGHYTFNGLTSAPVSPSLNGDDVHEHQQPLGQPMQETRSYGLPSIREILRVLISLLNPHDQQHTDSMRLMALGLLSVAFEIGGQSIGRFLVLRSLVADELCKYLFQVRQHSCLYRHIS